MAYHNNMATQQTGSRGKKPAGKFRGIPPAFRWVIAFIVILLAILAILPSVRETWEARTAAANDFPEWPERLPEFPEITDIPTPPQDIDEPPPEEIEPEDITVLPPTEPDLPPDPPPPQTRSLAVYFMQLDADGNILHPIQVNRQLEVSAPLRATLDALLEGTTAEEERQGLENFIPHGTRIRSVSIAGGTAIIDFTEEFQFNPFGREGSAAQLQQIVWTATQFPNVQNVQIYIEGQRVAFLHEGVSVANPIGR